MNNKEFEQAINFANGKYGELGTIDQRRNQLADEEEIKIELKEKLSKGEITHEEYLQEYDEQVKGSFKGLNQIDDFKLDNNTNIGEVYFVTREKQDPEYSEDKYMCYEIYDKNTGNIIGDTDRENNLNIYDQKILDKYPELEQQAKKMFVMAKMNESTGKAEDNVVVKNSVDYEQDNKMQLLKDMKEDKEHTVYNKMEKENEIPFGEPDENEKEAENEEQLMNKANKGKNNVIKDTKQEKEENNNGKGEVVEAKLIEDPSVRDNIPDATAKTWMVRYEDGSLGMLNGRGEILDSVTQIDQAQEVIDTVDKTGDDDRKIETTFAIKGKENGLVFPATLENNQMQLNIQDREKDPQIVIPVQMQGYTETRDNMEFINVQKTIDELLLKDEYKEMLKKDPEIANEILKMCYEQNDTSIKAIQQNIDYCNEEYIDEHKMPEDREILTPAEEAMKRRFGSVDGE